MLYLVKNCEYNEKKKIYECSVYEINESINTEIKKIKTTEFHNQNIILDENLNEVEINLNEINNKTMACGTNDKEKMVCLLSNAKKMKRKITVIYHADTDGLLAASLIKKIGFGNILFIPNKSAIFSYYDFLNIKEKAQGFFPLILLLDCGANEQSFSEYERYGFSCAYIDHHPNPNKKMFGVNPHKKGLENASDYTTAHMCAEILHRLKKSNKKEIEKYVEISYASDHSCFYKGDVLIKEYADIIDRLARSKKNVIKKVERFIKKPDEVLLIKERDRKSIVKQSILNYVNKVGKNLFFIELEKIVEQTKEKSLTYIINQCQMLLEKKPYILFGFSKDRVLIRASKKSEMDCLSLIEELNKKGCEVKGGGHKHACSFVYKGREKELKKKIIELFA